MRRFALVPFALVALLAGCSVSSSDGDATPTRTTTPEATRTTTAAPTGPDCSAVWKAGATLPADYDGCVVGGKAGAQDVTRCQDGSSLVAFDDTYFAITGGRITQPDVAPMQDTEEFGQAYSACTGED